MRLKSWFLTKSVLYMRIHNWGHRVYLSLTTNGYDWSQGTECTCFYPLICKTKVYLFLSLNVYDMSLDTESTCFCQIMCMTGVWTQSLLVFIYILKFEWSKCNEIVSVFKTRKKFSLSFNLDQFPAKYPEKCIMWLALHQ